MSIERKKRIEDLAPKRQSPITYNDIKGDIFTLCSNRWPLIDFDNIIDSFKNELNYQLHSFVENTDRLRFLEYLLEDLETHHNIWEVHGYLPNLSSKDGQYISATIKSTIVREYIRKWKDKVVRPPKKDKPKPKPKTLREIWEGNDYSYDKLIKILKTNQPDIGASFVNEINGKLVWNKQPPKGFAQYIAGMLHTLMKKGWTKDHYSAPLLASIIKGTFDITIDHNPLKSIGTNPPNEMFTAPFKLLASNLKT